jgi:hypothetical protein
MLDLELQIGADFCSKVIDYALRASSTTLVRGLQVGESLGVHGLAFSSSELHEAVDTGCDVAHRRSQSLLADFESSQSGPTIDLNLQDASGTTALSAA